MNSTVRQREPFVVEQPERIGDATEEAAPGLLASRAFWIGGALSIAAWTLLYQLVAALAG